MSDNNQPLNDKRILFESHYIRKMGAHKKKTIMKHKKIIKNLHQIIMQLITFHHPLKGTANYHHFVFLTKKMPTHNSDKLWMCFTQNNGS